MTLDELPVGSFAVVLAVDGNAALAQRLAEQGLFPGESVEHFGTAPLGDPLEIVVGGTHLSLRKADAAYVRIQPANTLPS